jgi:hypothetical protein
VRVPFDGHLVSRRFSEASTVVTVLHKEKRRTSREEVVGDSNRPAEGRAIAAMIDGVAEHGSAMVVRGDAGIGVSTTWLRECC